MATQSLYRRYRPRRFSELKGQDHVVRALRTSVAEGREGQAYLFSGPRGTGKTSSARILAKVLNCHHPVDGEPCCECESCLSVEQGTSYDVHELDAASNNGVDAMRDLIEKASLGTPGRHKVYILDEVHMLSKGAEAALLKTLEEPPPHVVFVLATTDPQKMSDTIRSRTQHLQFHLLGADTLQEHVRWVAADAGLSVTDEAIEQVIAQGAGSPRDTLSALELVANTGGAATETIAFEECIEAMIDNDPGRALTMVAQAIGLGRDPRNVTEELIRLMRNGFLSLMAPDLVQMPAQRIEALTDLSRRLGAAGLVRGIEHLGAALTEMRQAPDPRVLLDVAIVQLTSDQVATDVAGLAMRVQKLERQIADGGGPAPAAANPPVPAAAGSTTPTATGTAPTGRRQLGSRAGSAPTGAADVPTDAVDARIPDAADAAIDSGESEGPTASTGVEPSAAQSGPAPGREPASASGTEFGASDWDGVRPTLRGMVKAVFSPAVFVSSGAGVVVLGLPNDAHRTKCEAHREAVEAAVSAHAGVGLQVELIVQGGGDGSESRGGAVGAPRPDSGAPQPATRARAVAAVGSDPVEASSRADSMHGALARDVSFDRQPEDVEPSPPHLSVVHDIPTSVAADEPVDAAESDITAPTGRAIAELARERGPQPDPDAIDLTFSASLPDEDDVDLDDLTDAPPEAVKSPMDRLAEAFPGSELIDDPY